MACGGPERMLSTMPRPQPMPPRLGSPSRNTSGISKSPDQKKRCRARSAGENPTATPCLAATNPAAHPSEAPIPHSAPMRTAGGFADGVLESTILLWLRAGDFCTADTLGSTTKSICQSKTLTSSGWKAHGEGAQSHHYLCCYRLDSHSVDVSASAGDRPGNRGCRHRRGRGRRGDCPPPRAQPARRPSRSDAGGVSSIPQGDQAAVECRGEHHHRWRADDDRGRTRPPGGDLQARSCVAQHGYDELRPLSDDPSLQGQVQIRLGGTLSRRVEEGDVQEHLRRYRIYPHHLRREQHALRDRVLRYRSPIHASPFP